MKLAVIKRAADIDWRAAEFSSEELVGYLSTEGYEIGEKDGQAFLPVLFKEGTTRRAENVTHMAALVGDIDHQTAAGLEAAEQAIRARGFFYLAYNSHSHSPPGDCRARFIIPFKEPLEIEPKDWSRRIWPALIEYFGQNLSADPQCRDAARLYFTNRRPAAMPDGSAPTHRGWHFEGPLFDPTGVVDRGPVEPQTPPTASPPIAEDRSRPVDLGVIRGRLDAIKDERWRAFVQRLLAGEAIQAPPGRRSEGEIGRRTAWLKVTAVVALVCEGWESSDAILDVFRRSHEKEIAECCDDHTSWDDIERAFLDARVKATGWKAENERSDGAFRAAVASVSNSRGSPADGPAATGNAGSSVASVAFDATSPRRWPVLNQAAFHGLAGEIVRFVDPFTESDPVALLFQLLVSFGNVIGRLAFITVEGRRHYFNLFAVLVGRTARGRKGTSWGRIKQFFPGIATKWMADCVTGGLSSGEGIIWAVRDEVERHDKKGVRQVEPGVRDKRRLLIEEEFASVLRVLERDGNTLSAIIRRAWDDGNLSSLTKNSPAKATGAHISIVGHIVADELRRYLSSTEQSNGFGNRFLWICAKRSKLLPMGGGSWPAETFVALQVRLESAIQFGLNLDETAQDNSAVLLARQSGFGTPRELFLSEEARGLWEEVYPQLSGERPGLMGSLTARSEPNALRLAGLYALLEQTERIERPHLEAALGLVRYVEQSVGYIFGEALGDSMADEILHELEMAGSEGMTRTEVRDLFGRHRNPGRALRMLHENGRAWFKREVTKGRPLERWFAVLRRDSEPATEAANATEGPSSGASVASDATVPPQANEGR